MSVSTFTQRFKSYMTMKSSNLNLNICTAFTHEIFSQLTNIIKRKKGHRKRPQFWCAGCVLPIQTRACIHTNRRNEAERMKVHCLNVKTGVWSCTFNKPLVAAACYVMSLTCAQILSRKLHEQYNIAGIWCRVNNKVEEVIYTGIRVLQTSLNLV